ncbi:glycoside hydrolase family 2 protein [Mucilaginibacter aquatilis]|uniref:Glycoside hydrolase family 2 n=1 Tax=Mucilaginibacter aquatilis TaxID=1517760 RepID=A0A6I4IH84_9SPHI|nr:glycoside hydrolase family 2 protein [Mucilaginibacter aquatilis]MVN92978.1 glycoside hydrolase family 2 [Mucilaginibacter aquatilis]
MRIFFLLMLAGIASCNITSAQSKNASLASQSSIKSVFLRSLKNHQGAYTWQMIKASEAGTDGNIISTSAYHATNWKAAIVPGTVLTSLVANKVYPEPYYSDNNRKTRKLIPDISDAGREFYHYWFRTNFKVPASFKGKRLWLKFHGINYHSTIWLNGKRLGQMKGMFNSESFDISKIANLSDNNILAVDIEPVDHPGSTFKPGKTKTGAVGENHNGGDGEIGKDVTMLMSVGWDFTTHDGIRDRNTGIWRDIELFATGDVTLENAFVKSKLPLPDTTSAKETVSVEVKNASGIKQTGYISGTINETGKTFKKTLTLLPHETRTVTFSPAEYAALNISRPKLWWPVNKGNQALYTLSLKFVTSKNVVTHSLDTKFGIREITSDQNTPDKSRRFLVNGVPIFIRGTNWIPEAMLKNSEARTKAELRYTRQSGLNFLRLWGGGIAESDYFYQLCDEYGILVWTEFWVTADTKLPTDTALYFKNVVSTVKRIRNHASLAYYVDANEGKEVPGTGNLINQLDPTRGYQEQSECCGVHDGSPYKYENPMQYFENTASPRGSRVDGFNPEYGTLSTPVLSSLQKMMPAKDLWPINDSVWNYLDGNGFHGVTGKYHQAVNEFGRSSSIKEYAQKAQLVGALNFRAIWEVWNYNKFNYGDRWASGFLFWYHNSPLPQTASRMYDWYLEPTAALYYSQNGLAPLHAQFDYLKNTVSVYNDYRKAFKGYRAEATVYDFNSKPVWTKSTTINIPEDGVVKDAITISFPPSISQIHFIKLRLLNADGKLVNDAFYWRSKDAYKGAWTLTGPAVSGFKDINQLPKASLSVSAKKQAAAGKQIAKVVVKNPSENLAFFTQLQLRGVNGQTYAPVYYSDNFFSLLPGEEKSVTIEIPESANKTKLVLVSSALNSSESVTPVSN